MTGYKNKAETLSYVCEHVFYNTRPILLVCHERDGDWQFLCGATHPGAIPKVVGMEHLLERDPSLKQILQLPLGCDAERTDTSSVWLIAERPGDYA